jgi:hypothetical protein
MFNIDRCPLYFSGCTIELPILAEIDPFFIAAPRDGRLRRHCPISYQMFLFAQRGSRACAYRGELPGRPAELRDKEKLAEFRRRADEVRAIAQGIFDHGERQAVLEFVDNCEKLFVGNGAAL